MLTVLYYDVLTILPLPNTFSAIIFLRPHFMENNGIYISPYTVDSLPDMIDTLPWILALLNMMIFSILLNKDLKTLLNNLPNCICLGFFISTIILSAARIIMLLNDTPSGILHIYTTHAVSYGSYYINRGIIIRFSIIILLLVFFSLKKNHLHKIKMLENKLQSDYQNSIAGIYNELRCIRHDLSNHLTAMNLRNDTSLSDETPYKNSLIALCDNIDKQLESQSKWQLIDVPKLSSWEKYELYQFMDNIKNKYGDSTSELHVNCSFLDGLTTSDFTITNIKLRCCRMFRIKTSSLYALMKIIAQRHNGTIIWEKGENSCTLYLFLK